LCWSLKNLGPSVLRGRGDLHVGVLGWPDLIQPSFDILLAVGLVIDPAVLTITLEDQGSVSTEKQPLRQASILTG